MDKDVTIHLLLLKEEKYIEEGTTDYLNKAMSIHQGLPPKLKLNVEKQYKNYLEGLLNNIFLKLPI